MVDFKFPDVGEGITEGEIVKWRVEEGDKVKQDQILVEVETDKAVVELPSPEAGIVSKIYHKEGDTVKVGEALVSIQPPSSKKKSVEIPKETKLQKSKDVGAVVGVLEEAENSGSGTLNIPKKSSLKVVPSTSNDHLHALPAVRRLAKELKVDISKLQGTGKDGRITEEDVRQSAKSTKETEPQKPKVVKKYDLYGYIDHVQLKGVRKIIARRMVESVRTSPHVTHMDFVDVTHLSEVHNKEQEIAKKKKVHLTFLPYIIKALIKALKEHPYLNSSIDEGNEEVILKKYYNIGIAVDTEDGLMVPVIKVADIKNIYQLAKEISELSEKARSRKIDLGDLKGGTFTITNVGSIGGIFATPIINQPEVAILALGRIQEKPMVIEGRIVIRRMLPLSLTFDHRAVDGAEGARFTETLKKYLSDPDLLIE